MSKPDETPEEKQNRLLVRLSILQLIPAVVGIFIATLALYAALNESDAVRKQQQATVWPHIQVDRTNTTTTENVGITIRVSNRGIGPAKVRAANVLLDGEHLTGWNDLFGKLQPEATRVFPRTDSRMGESVLVPGVDVVIIDLNTQIYTEFDLESMEEVASRQETEDLVLAFREALNADRIETELCYCSVFDDCWYVSSINRDPSPVRNCAVYSKENSF